MSDALKWIRLNIQIGEEQESPLMQCGVCPYAEVKTVSPHARWKPPIGGLFGCALDRVRGVAPEPRYERLVCRFGLTARDIGLSHEKISYSYDNCSRIDYTQTQRMKTCDDVAEFRRCWAETMKNGKK